MFSDIFERIPSAWAQITGRPKYAFTGEELTIDFPEAFRFGPQTLFGIQALRDIPEHQVKKGDLGGFVQEHANLSHAGSAWVADNGMVICGGFVGAGVIQDSSLLVGGSCYGVIKNFSVVTALYGGGIMGEVNGQSITVLPTGSSLASAMMPEWLEDVIGPYNYPVRIVNYKCSKENPDYPERRNKVANQNRAYDYFRKNPVFSL